MPGPGGRAIPTVEVFDRDAGRVVAFANPAAARVSQFNNSPDDPGVIRGFDPQPDPPVFGMATLRSNQRMRLNVECFPHPVNGYPPNPCSGEVMFHDAAGNVVLRAAYALDPGQAQSFEVAASAVSRATFSAIVPCVLPNPGGRAVPSLEITDGAGGVALSITPAAARMSDFQQLTAR